jgi:hypothetical protein
MLDMTVKDKHDLWDLKREREREEGKGHHE